MILNIYKPPGYTSFSIVKSVKYITSEKKVGHGGTLDPFAEGVLIIGTGKDTKKLSEITQEDKSYEASLSLGVTTSTLDPEGVVVKRKCIPTIEIKNINKILNSFKGKSIQIPPMYSAKKINGVRLYKLARKNIEIPREPINIFINTISLIKYKNKQIVFNVKCSKGTYVRVLGKDIAEKLGTVGYLNKLVRISVGKFSIEDSIKIEDLRKSWKS